MAACLSGLALEALPLVIADALGLSRRGIHSVGVRTALRHLTGSSVDHLNLTRASREREGEHQEEKRFHGRLPYRMGR